jgi:hypothetical protein
MFSSAVCVFRGFSAGPREVAKALTFAISFLIVLVWLNASNVSLSYDESVIDYPFSGFRCFEPYF